MEERKRSESWSGLGGAYPLLAMYCNDMDSLCGRRMAFRYSIVMLVVGVHVSA